MKNLSKYFTEISKEELEQEYAIIRNEVYIERNPDYFLNNIEVKKIKEYLYSVKKYADEEMNFKWCLPPKKEEFKHFTLKNLDFNYNKESSEKTLFYRIEIYFDKKSDKESIYDLSIKKSLEDWFFVMLNSYSNTNSKCFKCDGLLGLLKLIDFLIKS